jgi:hypothetical protein
VLKGYRALCFAAVIVQVTVLGEAHSAWQQGRVAVTSACVTGNSAAASTQEADQNGMNDDKAQSVDAVVGTAATSSSASLTSTDSSNSLQSETDVSVTTGSATAETAVILIEGSSSSDSIQERTLQPEQIAADSNNSIIGLPSSAPGVDSIAEPDSTSDTATTEVSADKQLSFRIRCIYIMQLHVQVFHHIVITAFNYFQNSSQYCCMLYLKQQQII